MADVADDGLVLHLLHVFVSDHVQIARGGNKNIRDRGRLFHGHHAETLHRGLQGADGVDFRHPHGGTQAAQGLGATLADVAVAGNHRNLARDHDVRGALDAVDQGLAAAVEIIELGLGNRVVHVHGGEQQDPSSCMW